MANAPTQNLNPHFTPAKVGYTPPPPHVEFTLLAGTTKLTLDSNVNSGLTLTITPLTIDVLHGVNSSNGAHTALTALTGQHVRGFYRIGTGPRHAFTGLVSAPSGGETLITLDAPHNTREVEQFHPAVHGH